MNLQTTTAHTPTRNPWTTPPRSVRQEAMRQIDYAPFPRTNCDQGPQGGLSLNESETGLCVAISQPEAIGSLLRVMIRGVDGRQTRDVVTRVVWCNPSDDGRYRAGLALLRESRPQMMKVREPSRQHVGFERSA